MTSKDFDYIIELKNITVSFDDEKILDDIEAPKTPEEIGLGDTSLELTFKATKDIRDKYVLSRLAWDLGVIEELCK